MAFTVRLPLSVTVHVDVPGQVTPVPLQLVKLYPDEATAESVTTVPGESEVEHTLPQAIPPTSDVTVPTPDFVIVSFGLGTVLNVAVTFVLVVIVKLQGFVVPFEHTPVHPAKTLFVPAVARSESAVPDG